MLEVVTVCKGRWEHLQTVLPTWQQSNVNINVVDYGGPDNIFKELDKWKSSKGTRLHCIKVNHVDDTLNLSHARNIGFKRTTGDNLLFLSCDMRVDPHVFNTVDTLLDASDLVLINTGISGIISRSDLYGFIGVKRWVVERLRGFNEVLSERPNGWGYEDVDFVQRAISLSRQYTFNVSFISDALIQPIDHDDEIRTRYYTCKDVSHSYAKHKAFAEWYMTTIGLEANMGRDWGEGSVVCSRDDFWGGNG